MAATLVVGNNEVINTRLRDALVREGHDCAVSSLVAATLGLNDPANVPPAILGVVLSPEPELALTFLAAARGRAPGCVLAVGPALDPKLILRAMRAGADHYLDETDLNAELPAVLQRLRPAAAAPEESGRLVCVLGAGGGCGASTVAANVATVLAKEHKTSLLLELKAGAGDLGALLDLKPTHTLADLCHEGSGLDRVMFERSLSKHVSGVHLLAPPPRGLGDPGRVPAEALARAVALARSQFPYVVADLEDCVYEEQAEVLAQSDAVVVVLRLDFATLRNARCLLERLGLLGLHPECVRLVANRHGQPKEVPASKAEEALGVKIAHFLPDDPRTANWCINNGVPAVEWHPRSALAKGLVGLAKGVNGRHREH